MSPRSEEQYWREKLDIAVMNLRSLGVNVTTQYIDSPMSEGALHGARSRLAQHQGGVPVGATPVGDAVAEAGSRFCKMCKRPEGARHDMMCPWVDVDHPVVLREQTYYVRGRRPVAVAEDPVREAAKELIEGWAAYEIKTYTAEGQRLINALREALAQPAPPSLTEGERKALRRYLKDGTYSSDDHDVLLALREKLS